MEKKAYLFDLFLKEVINLPSRSSRRIRSMRSISFDRESVGAADRAGLGQGRVGGAHDIAPVGDGVIPLEDHDHDGAGGHEIGQAGVERLGFMDDVKALGFLFREMDHLHLGDGESLVFDDLDEAADDLFLDGVGLDDGQRLFHGEASFRAWLRL